MSDLFAIAPEFDRKQIENFVLPLRRSVRQELTMLAVSIPLMMSDVSAVPDEEVFATDASLVKGAIVSRHMPHEQSMALWLGGDKKGGYSKLDNPFREMMRHVAEESDNEEEEEFQGQREPISRQPPLRFDFVEVCGGDCWAM